MSALVDVAKRTAEKARAAGAGDARVHLSRSREVRVEWRDGKLDRIRESTRQRLTVSLYVEGRYSSNATSDLREEALGDWLRASVAATRHLAPDEHRRLPDPKRYEGAATQDLELADAAVARVTPEERLRIAAEMEAAARKGEGAEEVVSVTSTVSDSEGRNVCVTTNGLVAEEEDTAFTRVVEVAIRDEGDRKPNDYGWAVSRFAADLPPGAELALDARTRALEQRGSKQIATGAYEIVFENRAAPTFARHLLAPLSGGSLQQRRSFLEGRLGEAVTADILTITDEPHLPRGLASTRWDGEGMVTVPRPVFEKGVLRNFFINTYYGSKLGRAPTTASPSNLVWQPGRRDAGAMVADLAEGIYVTGFLGGNSNATTGDFSLGIKGFYVKDGVAVHPISEMNIAGNHLAFWKQLAEVGDDPWPYSSNRTPSLRFTGVQCSGA